MKKKYPSLWGEAKWWKYKRFSITELVLVIALWSIPMCMLFVEVK